MTILTAPLSVLGAHCYNAEFNSTFLMATTTKATWLNQDENAIGSPADERRRNARSLKLVLLLIGVLSAMHLVYVAFSRMVPSTDEAHYMSGVLSIVEGIRTGTLGGAWSGYVNALGFKAPLVCVPAAVLMWIFGGLVLPCNLSLVVTFAALGISAYHLFRRCVRPSRAVAATFLLLTTPMVTGLTHRFYVELLFLLLAICYLDVLAANPWERTRVSCALGLITGLGVLCKLTFPVLVALPTAYSLFTVRGALSQNIKASLRLVLNTVLAGGIALAVAAPWYAHGQNFRAVWEHSKIAASAEACFYPHWIQADLSSGPGVFIAVVAIPALVLVGRDLLARRRIKPPAAQVWILVLLLGLSTVIASASTVNKATRFSVTALPAFALLATMLWDYCRPGVVRRYGLYLLCAISGLLSLQVSFAAIPAGAVQAGDLVLFGSHFPLNVPGWFDDNHPVDRRDFHLDRVDDVVAADAAKRFSPGQAVHARITEFGLLINFDYLGLLSRAHKHSIQYLWWPGAASTGPDAPEYIIAYKGFRDLYPGVHFFEYYPNLERDVESGRVPYELVARLDGAANTHILVYGKKALESLAGAAAGENKLYIEAENFNRGNATVDNGQYGYGAGIGVIVTLKPPPTFVEYDFTLPRDGTYQLELRYASAVPRPVRILIDNLLINSHAADAATGGFQPADQQWHPVAVAALMHGNHVLRIESTEVFPHIDQILFVRRP